MECLIMASLKFKAQRLHMNICAVNAPGPAVSSVKE